MGEPQRKSLALPDGDVSYLEWNEARGAPLLMFLHANGFNALTYRTLLSPLAGDFRIIAPDQRAHGMTDLPTQPPARPRWALYRDDLIRFVERLGEKPAILTGHSLGATVSLLATAKQPDLAQGLVLAEPVMQPARYAVSAMVLRKLGLAERYLPRVGMTLKRRARFTSRDQAASGFRGRGIFKRWPDRVVTDYVEGGTIPDGDGFRLACDPAWEAEFYATYRFRLAAEASRVKVPVAILTGTEESATDPNALANFLRRTPNATAKEIPGTSHFLPMEEPDIVRGAIRAMASQILPGPAFSGSRAVE